MPSSRRSGHGFKHFICAPVRLMSRFVDMYVNNMNKLAAQMSNEAPFGCSSYAGPSHSYNLRSIKRSLLEDELAELFRAATEKNRAQSAAARNMRCRSAAITRIDEDKPCDFKDSDLNLGLGLNFARSRTCAPAQLGPFGLRSRYSSSDRVIR